MSVILSVLQPFNVLRYQTSQHYDAHYDIFEPENYGPQPSQRVRPPAVDGNMEIAWSFAQTKLSCRTALVPTALVVSNLFGSKLQT